jgi:competence protein ComEC
MKVAHHGSKNFTCEEFLALIRPELSLISCGRNNSYGHPHVELLERLVDVGCEVVITSESGAISIKTDGKMLRIKKFVKTME